MRRIFFGLQLLNLGMLAGFAMLPAHRVYALELGEIAVHSFLGQPFRASVPIGIAAGEEVDGSCFSLGKPSDSRLSYLAHANLSVGETAGRRVLNISTLQSVGEPYVKLVLNANCGPGRLSREFTVLLDPDDGPVVRPIAVVEPAAPLPPVLEVQVAASEGPAAGTAGPLPAAGAKRRKTRAAAPREKAEPAAVAARGGGEFRLKLSTSELDLSAVGTLTEEQRQMLRERQRFLDADDQVTAYLSLKSRLKQLETQVGALHAAIDRTNGRLALSEKIGVPPETKAAPVTAAPATAAPSPQAGMAAGGAGYLGWGGIVALLAVPLLALGVWWRWRRKRSEERLELELQQEFPPDAMAKLPREENAEVPNPIAQPEAHERTVLIEEPRVFDEDEELARPTSIFEPRGNSVTLTEAESALDEADLYLAYGWANRAIELLQGYIEHHPDDPQLWEKLFEIYSGQGMKREFAQLAERCVATVSHPGLLASMRKLGRQLDPENELYLTESAERASRAPQPPEPEAVPEQAGIPTLEFVFDEDAGPDRKSPAAPAESDPPLDLPDFDRMILELGESGGDGKGKQTGR